MNGSQSHQLRDVTDVGIHAHGGLTLPSHPFTSSSLPALYLQPDLQSERPPLPGVSGPAEARARAKPLRAPCVAISKALLSQPSVCFL